MSNQETNNQNQSNADGTVIAMRAMAIKLRNAKPTSSDWSDAEQKFPKAA